MILTLDLLCRCVPHATELDAGRHLDSLNEGMERWQITTPARVAAFLAQIGHESGDFAHTEENLNYSAEALRRVFAKYFPTDERARQYARRPEAIANLVYANRMGNRDASTGDGWFYRGRGLVQITGRSNYALYAPWGIDTPGELATAPHAALSACWYWGTRGLNELAGAGDFQAITRKINGGLNGQENRVARWRVAEAELAQEDE